jgi:hypothetical protein
MTGTASEVLEQDLGLFISSWYSIAIAVFVSASWYAISGRPLKRGAGYFMPGVWGCPPALINPPRLGD